MKISPMAAGRFVGVSVFVLLGMSLAFAQASQDKDAAGQQNGQDVTVYEVGNGVTPPKAVYAPNPEYTERARKAKINGYVIISLIVTIQGKPEKVRVKTSLEPDLDKKAVEAVRSWRFEPSTKDGKAVAVNLNVEVDFRLY